MKKQTLKTKSIQTTQTINASKYLINLLRENGTDTIFGYPGAPILPLYEELSKTKEIKHYLSRHEQGAIHCAEGYAKVKNKPGIVLTTSGPGFSNVITGLINANLDNTPLIVITAQSETKNQNEFQDIDIMNISKPCSKNCYEIDSVDKIEKVVKTAFSECMKVPQGPVVIAIKNSVLNDKTSNVSEYKPKQEIKVDAPHSYVKKALKSLENSKSPIMIVGGGAKNAKQEIFEFVKYTHIPVVNTMMGIGCADDISLGMIGIDGDEYLNKKIQNADVIIAVGTRFTNRTTLKKPHFLKKAKIYNINISSSTSPNVKIERNLIGESKIVLQHMIETIKSQNYLFNINYHWIESLSNQKEYDTSKLTLESALETIHSYTKKYYPIITTDVGLHQTSCARIFKTIDPSHFLTSGGLGTMGFGLPASIGAQIANPNSVVINITGDGSFQMNIQELGTIAQYNLPIKIFILNNSALGMIKTLQKTEYNNTFESDLLNPDFIKIANAYGIKGYNISSITQLENALKEIFTNKKSILLNINIPH